jgi:hypothetical protein
MALADLVKWPTFRSGNLADASPRTRVKAANVDIFNYTDCLDQQVHCTHKAHVEKQPASFFFIRILSESDF